MFTGLVKEIGKVVSVRNIPEGKELIISSKVLLPEIEIDDSVSINGACQTATRVNKDSFVVQTIHSSLEKTTLGSLRSGDEVNMELALRLSDRLGGHLVQGHVNGVGEVTEITNQGKNYLISIRYPGDLKKYIVKEGSITIDGISLTIAYIDDQKSTFTLSIIPHTWENTVLRNRKVGSSINLEIDVIAKYVERLLKYGGGDSSDKKTSMSEDWIRSRGF